MILTRQFDPSLYSRSDTAIRKGIDNTPPPEVVSALMTLHEKLLVPLMATLPGQINVTSGYRCAELNVAIGGKPNSQHKTGCAADVEYFENGIEVNHILREKLKESGLEFDQCIDEYGRWVHLSFNSGHNRRQFLTIS